MNAKLLLCMLVIFVIVGCSQEKEVIKHEENNSTSVENRKDTIQKPPNLKVSVNGEAFMAASHGYSWSYYDEEEKSMAGIEAEVVAVSDLIGNRKGPAVNPDTSIELKFAEEPISYEVYVLGSFPSNRGTDVVLDKQSGRTIYEVKATWEQGTGYYVFPLTIE
ncbi:hypothetical protein DHX103_00495 [Planococcus sp. X10-3]|uniref:hypothetical protein n=1 Tax=Planococcus sp. X10-3 TaxID=3061240 RepID=UPI003BAE1548